MKKLALLATGFSLGAALSARAADKIDFAKDVQPILAEHCLKCHGEDKQKGKYRIDTKADALKGGKSGATAVVAGDAAKSEMIRRITLPKDNDEMMPPEGGPLPEKAIQVLKQWVAEGAAWPDGAVVKAVAVAGGAAGTPPAAIPAAPRRPLPPLPELPKEFNAPAGEAGAIAALAKAGVDVRPLAQNTPWKEVNFRLKGAEVNDAMVAPVKDIASLVEVRLGTTKVTDAALAALAALPHLQVLSLELTGVTDAGLAQIAKLKNLVYLNLYGTGVTDAGLEQLKGLKHLRNLYLWQTKVTPEAAKRLGEALPGCDVNTGAELVPPPAPEKKEEKKEEKK